VLFALSSASAPVHAQASDTTKTRVTMNGFVDTYYAYDFTRPADGERRYTTQPARHDEFNVNLVWLGVTIERQRTRARVALQAGTSVQSNYSGEPRNGATSGPDVSRFIQEGVVGVKLAPKLWLDAGVYYSYIGLESWSSSDNPTYTRSLVADYTPYYLSGAKLTWQPNAKLTAQLHVINGWQNISESNRRKAVGGRVDYAVAPALTLSYATFIGDEAPDTARRALRVFNQVMAKGQFSTATQWQAQIDAGRQAGDSWYGAVAILRRALNPRVALVGRVERYADGDAVIVPASNGVGFVGNGGSLGVDVTIDDGVRWRSEWRSTRTSAPLYPRATGPTRNNGLLVTSLSAAF
jgi:hypothetical protein